MRRRLKRIILSYLEREMGPESLYSHLATESVNICLAEYEAGLY